jgi:hypothetical protein
MLGEHIRALKGGRWYHAVDCGDETVLHLVDEPGPRRVRRSYRPDFVAGAEQVETVVHREPTYPAKEIVARGYSRAADPALAIMFGDSEAFAEWCSTGRLPPGQTAPVAATPPPPLVRAKPARARASKPAAAAKPAKRRGRAGRTAAPKRARKGRGIAAKKPARKAKVRTRSSAPRKAAAKARRASAKAPRGKRR